MLGFNSNICLLVVSLSWALQYYTFGSAVLWYIFAVLLILSVVYALSTYDHGYWASRGVYSPPAYPFVGHILSVMTFKEQGGLCFKRIYDEHKHLRFLGEFNVLFRNLK
jgi:hypothetical protein